jgi:hypothetical protein
LPSERKIIPDLERSDFAFIVPGLDGLTLKLPYAKWAEFHAALGAELAKRMRLET